MRTIARLFGKSPFALLKQHMEKVATCMAKLEELFQAFIREDYSSVESFTPLLSHLEHEADIMKNDIRNHLHHSLFLAIINRDQLLDILSIQDTLADTAETIGLFLSLSPLSILEEIKKDFQSLFQKTMETFWHTNTIVNEIHSLFEASFGGIEAEKVKDMVEQVASAEDEAELLKHQLLKQLFIYGKEWKAFAFLLCFRMIEEISSVAHTAERLANRIRMLLHLK